MLGLCGVCVVVNSTNANFTDGVDVADTDNDNDSLAALCAAGSSSLSIDS